MRIILLVVIILRIKAKLLGQHYHGLEFGGNDDFIVKLIDLSIILSLENGRLEMTQIHIAQTSHVMHLECPILDHQHVRLITNAPALIELLWRFLLGDQQ